MHLIAHAQEIPPLVIFFGLAGVWVALGWLAGQEKIRQVGRRKNGLRNVMGRTGID